MVGARIMPWEWSELMQRAKALSDSIRVNPDKSKIWPAWKGMMAWLMDSLDQSIFQFYDRSDYELLIRSFWKDWGVGF